MHDLHSNPRPHLADGKQPASQPVCVCACVCLRMFALNTCVCLNVYIHTSHCMHALFLYTRYNRITYNVKVQARPPVCYRGNQVPWRTFEIKAETQGETFLVHMKFNHLACTLFFFLGGLSVTIMYNRLLTNRKL